MFDSGIDDLEIFMLNAYRDQIKKVPEQSDKHKQSHDSANEWFVGRFVAVCQCYWVAKMIEWLYEIDKGFPLEVISFWLLGYHI